MFDIEQFLADCRAARAEGRPSLAVKEVLQRAVSTPAALVESLSPSPAGLNFLFRAPDLTVINALWPPHMSLFPHDHRMWAVIAIYQGQEDNSFYRRHGTSIAASGGKEIRRGDVLLLGTDAIHAVSNPGAGYTGALHVYGGDFVGTPRSQWDEATLEEQPFDLSASASSSNELTTHMSPVEAVVVGAGQAGLSASHELDRHGIDHVVLERSGGPGGRWKSRWESFCLVTINENCRLPGFPYDGPAPDGFMARDEIVAYLARYAALWDAPVDYQTDVLSIRPGSGPDRWVLSTSRGQLTARNVIVATGPFQRPKVPAWADRLPTRLTQLHSDHYVSSEHLPDGPVLVVGSGQSGAQYAEELNEHGRRVYLGVSRCGRRPRRYRGRDVHAWVALMRRHANEQGTLRTVEDLESPRDRFACNPHLSGKHGGHEVNLRQLAVDGVTLLGRPSGVREATLLLDPDLIANLDGADAAAAQSRRTIDDFVTACGLDAPEETIIDPALPDPPVRSELDLGEAKITSVIWATGYRLDFSWIAVPGLCDNYGYPWHERGLTEHRGLSFLGLPWLHTEASSLLLGMETDAPHLVEQLMRRANAG